MLQFSLSISLSHSYASNSLKRPSSLRPSFPLSSAPFLVLFILLCLFLPLLVGARGLARLPSSSSSSSSPSPLASQWMAFLALAAAFPSKGCLLHSRVPAPSRSLSPFFLTVMLTMLLSSYFQFPLLVFQSRDSEIYLFSAVGEEKRRSEMRNQFLQFLGANQFS